MINVIGYINVLSILVIIIDNIFLNLYVIGGVGFVDIVGGNVLVLLGFGNLIIVLFLGFFNIGVGGVLGFGNVGVYILGWFN